MSKGKTVRVRVRVGPNRFGGHWRAGKHWPTGASEADVTPAELEQLEADGQLSVRVLDGEGQEAVNPLRHNFPGRGALIEAGFDTEDAVRAQLDSDPNALKSLDSLDDDKIQKIKVALNWVDPNAPQGVAE